jgi:hypothetical protein
MKQNIKIFVGENYSNLEKDVNEFINNLENCDNVKIEIRQHYYDKLGDLKTQYTFIITYDLILVEKGIDPFFLPTGEDLVEINEYEYSIKLEKLMKSEKSIPIETMNWLEHIYKKIEEKRGIAFLEKYYLDNMFKELL